MAKFQNGDRVSLIANPSTRGVVDLVYSIEAGHQFYDIKLDTGLLQQFAEHELTNEIVNLSPWQIFEQNLLSDYRNFAIASTVHKIKNTAANTISTLKASRTIFKPYQFKPLVKFLKSTNKRILIADEVGLGKTIEAGHIILEMAARNDLRNLLVICTKSLREKWKTELQDKFNITLKLYDNVKDFIEDIKIDISAQRKSIFGILNYEKCRDKKIEDNLTTNGYFFDLLICDEAHKIRNSETEQHKGVDALVKQSSAVVFMTATPVMTDIRNLFNLIRLLDREAYDNFSIFNNAIKQNKPFINSLSKLNSNYPLDKIADELDNTIISQELIIEDQVVYNKMVSVGEIYADDLLYQRVKAALLTGSTNLRDKIRIQQDLIELNSLNHLYTRTRKKDVLNDDDKIIRQPHTISVELNDDERAKYEKIISEYGDTDHLGLIQKKRQFASCINAYIYSKEDLIAGKNTSFPDDSKLKAFESILDAVVIKGGKKIIVFAFFTKTLLYLKLRLNEKKIQNEIIYGDIENRAEVIEKFKESDDIKVLLSSEVGSEGLDLQFCDAIVNYDLPWNPMVVEQRIGRIDRVGQQSKVINIYNLIIKDTIEEKIFSRLYARINLFRESIGDLEEILGESEPLSEKIKKGIDSLYIKKLTEEQQNQILDQITAAIEFEKENLVRIQVDLKDAFSNDMHFQNEIENIEKEKRYLTENELVRYLEAVLRIHLSTLQLSKSSDYTYLLEVPAVNKYDLFDFVEQYKDAASINPELEYLYRKFKAKYYGERKIRLTFNQERAYKEKNLEYISAFHPIINAITNYFVANNYDKNQVHKICVSKDNVDNSPDLICGYYVLVLIRIQINKNYGDGKSGSMTEIYSILADLNGNEVKITDAESTSQIHSLVESAGSIMVKAPRFNEQVVNKIREKVGSEIRKIQHKVEEDEKVRFISSINRRAQQQFDYLTTMRKRLEHFLIEGRGVENFVKNDIRAIEQRIEKVKLGQENAGVSVNNSIVSINLIQIT